MTADDSAARPARWLKLLEEHFPALAALGRKAAVERLVPFNHALGIRLEKSPEGDGEVRLLLPAARRNTNVGGTIHGAAILALAETVHGTAVLWEFPPSTHRMVTKRAEIHYLAPATGPIRSAFRLEPAVRDGIRKDLESAGRSEIGLACEVTDSQGRTVARLSATYVVRRLEGGRGGRAG